MGRTHTYKYTKPLCNQTASLKAAFGRINKIVVIGFQNGDLAGSDGDRSTPIFSQVTKSVFSQGKFIDVTHHTVSFNGVGKEGACESFSFSTNPALISVYNFCKTRGRKYERYVIACFQILKKEVDGFRYELDLDQLEIPLFKQHDFENEILSESLFVDVKSKISVDVKTKTKTYAKPKPKLKDIFADFKTLSNLQQFAGYEKADSLGVKWSNVVFRPTRYRDFIRKIPASLGHLICEALRLNEQPQGKTMSALRNAADAGLMSCLEERDDEARLFRYNIYLSQYDFYWHANGILEDFKHLSQGFDLTHTYGLVRPIPDIDIEFTKDVYFSKHKKHTVRVFVPNVVGTLTDTPKEKYRLSVGSGFYHGLIWLEGSTLHVNTTEAAWSLRKCEDDFQCLFLDNDRLFDYFDDGAASSLIW